VYREVQTRLDANAQRGRRNYIKSSWIDPSQDNTKIRWTRALAKGIQPFTTGRGYVKMGHETVESAEAIKAAYGSTYDRLAALKNKYDPTNLFRLNPNSKPTV
jgi:hypothetical protein